MTAAVMPVRAVTLLGLLAVALACTGLPLQASEPDCTTCHAVDTQKFAASVHGFLSCTDCHSGAQQQPHPAGVKQVNCAACHADVVQQYESSVHGRARSRGAAEAPTCISCHGDLHVLVPRTDPASPVHPARLPETCGHCHANPELVAKFGIPIARPLEAYRASIHARAVAAGKGAATCNNCHGSHAIFPATDPRSSVFHQRVPDTCGTCHSQIAAYRNSIHGTAAARGVRDAPVCTDCHGEHRILSPQEPGSPVFATNIPSQTCGRCHADLRLSEKYGLPLDNVPAYQDSYHGLAGRAGVQTVANCASCHGVHDILPSSDPRSHVNRANLAQTCGQCHPGAGSRFALGPVHVVPTQARFIVVYYVRLFYLPLIYLVIGGMVAHNLLDLLRKARTPALRNLALVPAEEEERMSLGFRVAHGLVVISFPLLVYTGFALKYPESWWAQPVVHWEASLGLRGWLHRAAAVVLLGSVAFHVIHVARSRRARACIATMRPSLQDWHEFKHRLSYYFGWRTEPPHGVKLGYIEKSEYLSFLWGTVIMATTGFLLWFENFTLRWFPKWVSDAATAVHFYEAILASLAILVWHFYWVIFDPAVYPMDLSWWSGRQPVSRALERLQVPPAPAPPAPADPPPPSAASSGDNL